PSAERYAVTPDYFRTLGIPLRRGRLFTPADRADSVPVLLISETAAARFFPNEDPIGHRVRTGGSETRPWRPIVGVGGGGPHGDRVVPIEPQMYSLQAQWDGGQPVLIVKAASVQPESLMPSIRRTLGELDPAIPVFDVATMEARVAASIADRR